jgi:4-hydroxy-tetrahydrodipicolinate reductase
MIRVAVSGAAGRMGRETIRAIAGQSDLELVGAIDREQMGEDSGLLAGLKANGVPVGKPVETFEAARPEVLVDFTVASASLQMVLAGVRRGVRPVIGTSGLSPQDRSAIRSELEEQGLGGLLVPNFALGAVMMMKLAEQAAHCFPNFEIIEMHHDGKLDAPSGTASRTAERLSRCREEKPRSFAREKVTLEGARGAELAGVKIHSVRLPGLVAHQEIVFGGQGEVLTIRHDSLDRTSFMGGVLLAIRKVGELRGLVVGLETLL